MTGESSGGLSQGVKRRLFLAWTLWMWVAWLASGETQKVFSAPGAVLFLLSPGHPHLTGALFSALRAGLSVLLVLGALSTCGRAVQRVLGQRTLPFPAGAVPGGILLDLLADARILRLALGIAPLALALQGLGLAGLSGPAVLGPLAGVLAVPALVSLARNGLRTGSAAPGVATPRLLAVASWSGIAVAGLASLAPEIAWDAMVYHLRAPSLYLMEHKVYPVPEIFPSFFPFNGEMLLMLARALGGDPGARLLHVALWTACGAGTARLAGALWGPRAVSWALALALTLPLGTVISSRAYVEFFLVLPVLAASRVLLAGNGRALGGRPLLLVGLLAGAAAGTKYQGGLVGAVLCLFALSRARVRGRGLVLLVAGGCVAGAWWYLRNILWTGNPSYPLFFGGPRWTPADMAGWRADASAWGFDMRILLTTPWFLLSNPPFDGGIHPVLMSALAVPILWREGRSRVWGMAGVLLLVWWLTAPLPRYLAPALALAMAAAAGCITAREMGPEGEKWLERSAVLGLLIAVATGFSSIHFSTEPFGCALGKYDERAYRERRLAPEGVTQVMERLGKAVPPRGRAYMMGHAFAYDIPRRAWFDFLYVRNPLHWWLADCADPERILVRARQANLTHLAWNPAGGRVFHGRHPELMDWTPQRMEAWTRFWRANVREDGRFGKWRVFEITRGRGTNPQPREALPGTESVTGPIDYALDDGSFAEAEGMAREALAKYPSLAARLGDRLMRAKQKRQSILPLAK